MSSFLFQNNFASWMQKLKSFACVFDTDGYIQKANPSLAQLIGLSSEDLKGLPLNSLLGEEFNKSAEVIKNAIEELKTDDRSQITETIQLQLKDKLSNSVKTRWHFRFADPNNIDEGIFAIGWEDEEDSVLSDVYKKMQFVTAYTSDSILITDSHGVIEYLNTTFTDLTEYSPIEIIGQIPTRFLSLPEDMGEFHRVRELLTHGESWEGQVHIRKKNNEAITLSVHILPLKNKEEQISHYLCLGKDISKLQSLEKQIQELQRLESLSTLVNGVTHKFNNIIAGISGHSELLTMTHSEDLAIQKRVEQILAACNKGREFIAELNSFSRKEETRLRLVDISPVVRHVSQFAQKIAPQGITIVEEMTDELPKVMANTDGIHQVLLNVLTNAIQSMKDKQGLITLRVSPDLFHSTPSLLIEIEDNGSGIPDNIKDRIFEPLFTTKSLADASGMGLAVAHGIIQQHGGNIEVQTQVAFGSTISIRLPIFNASTQSSPPRNKSLKKNKLLLSGDENFFLRSGKAMLEEMGYEIETIKGYEATAEILHQKQKEYALLIFDFQTGVGNIEISKIARSISPNPPIILMANIERMPAAKQIQELQIDQVVYKPCPINKIGHTIRMLLDKNTL